MGNDVTKYGVGGLIGRAETTQINDCYAWGDVSGAHQVGGLVGLFHIMYNRGRVNNSYSTGQVTGTGSNVGGFIGFNPSLIYPKDCYWDTETSGMSQGIGNRPNPPAGSITGKTTAEMYQQATFTGWDFATIWAINEGNDYPTLINTGGGGDCSNPPVADAGEDVTIYIGYPPYNTQLNATGGVNYSWSPAEGLSDPSSANPIAQPAVSTTYTVTVTDANGCSAAAEVFVEVVDVRCGNNLDKVQICHVTPGKSGKSQTLCVAFESVAAHLAHGDYLGSCLKSYMDPGSSVDGAAENMEVGVYPNPFTQQTTIRVHTFLEGSIEVAIFAMDGKRIRVLKSEDVLPGVHQIIWNGDDNSGTPVPGGLYLARIISGSDISNIRMVKD